MNERTEHALWTTGLGASIGFVGAHVYDSVHGLIPLVGLVDGVAIGMILTLLCLTQMALVGVASEVPNR
jgi:hypothetical protein